MSIQLDGEAYREQLTATSTVQRLAAWGIPVAEQRVADLGCGRGGGTLAFAAAGASIHGIDINPAAIAFARAQASQRSLPATFAVGNALEFPAPEWQGRADLVLLQEVVEHVPDVAQTLRAAAAWVKPHGCCLVTFPPYYCPSGGHHHYGYRPYRYIPWLHLFISQGRLLRCLPEFYREEVRSVNRLTISRFEGAVKQSGWRVIQRVGYLIRPSISLRLSLPTIPAGWLATIPGIRELVVTGMEYLLRWDGTAHTASGYHDGASEARRPTGTRLRTPRAATVLWERPNP